MRGVLIGACAALLLASCGGEDGGATTGAARPDARAELVQRANAVCADATRRVSVIRSDLYAMAEDFEGTDKAYGRQLDRYYDRYARVVTQLFDRLKALERLVDDKRPLREYLSLVATLATYGSIAQKEWRRGDLERGETFVAELETRLRRGERLARGLGFERCVKLTQPLRFDR